MQKFWRSVAARRPTARPTKKPKNRNKKRRKKEERAAALAEDQVLAQAAAKAEEESQTIMRDMVGKWSSIPGSCPERHTFLHPRRARRGDVCVVCGRDLLFIDCMVGCECGFMLCSSCYLHPPAQVKRVNKVDEPG